MFTALSQDLEQDVQPALDEGGSPSGLCMRPFPMQEDVAVDDQSSRNECYCQV